LQVAQAGAFCDIPGMSDNAPSEPESWKRFRTAMRQILSVPKAEIERRDAEWRKAKAMKRSAKK